MGFLTSRCAERELVSISMLYRKGRMNYPRCLRHTDRSSHIFNADELGLFFKCTPDKTYTMKGELCKGGKSSKERVTVLVGANMDGSEKLPMLMNGKSMKPRCFKGVKSFPVEYTANKKAWTTGSIWEKWLRQLDKKFLRQKRKVLFFVDNCTAHIAVPNLQAIDLRFFPPNMTSESQPMDQGIIKNLKHFYRTAIVEKMLDEIEAGVKTTINVLQANRMLLQAWTRVKKETIANCFRKAEFCIQEQDVFDDLVTDDELEPVGWSQIATIPFSEYVAVDDAVNTLMEMTDEEIICNITAEKGDISDCESQNEGETDDEQSSAITSRDAKKMLDNLRTFFEGKEEVPEEVFRALDVLHRHTSTTQKQSEITSYFKRTN